MFDVYLMPFKAKHLSQLQEMHELRDHALGVKLTLQDLPKIGYIAFLGKQPVAAGFLRRIEPNYAQLDTFLSNPYFGSQVRHEAMTKIIDSLIADANELNLKGILAITADQSIKNRALALGFGVIEQTLFGKVLS